MIQVTDRTTTTKPDTSSTERWLTLARGAGFAIFAWMVLLTILAGDFIPPVVVLGLIAGVFAVFLKGERRKTGLGFAVFSVLLILGDARGVIDELSNLDSTPAFILTLLAVLGAGLGIVSGTGAFFGWSAAPVRNLAWGAAALMVILGATSAVVGARADSAEPLASDTPVTIERLEYAPATVTVDRGDGIWVDNSDGIRHTFTVEALDLDLEIPALKARRIDVDGPAGSYEVVCTVPGHENMTATLVIGS